MREAWSPAVARARQALVRLAASAAPARRAMSAAGRELERAARVGSVIAEARAAEAGEDQGYDAAYFGVGRDPSGARHGRSGYGRYDRVSSNADIAAYLIWRNFRAARTLDVGCAQGFLVEALRELGLEAEGCDVSRYAVEHATPGALGYVRLGNPLRRLPYGDGAFELVSALEVLEHHEPDQVDRALAELRRVCGGILYATIPSFGPNHSGPPGHFVGKVRPERLDHYASLAPDYRGPVPRRDLAVDDQGRPIEGHLTIASYEWWTERFSVAGFERWADVEARLYGDIAPAGLGQFWNLYVLAVPGTART
jgi:SAM-dependent methyltransferase